MNYKQNVGMRGYAKIQVVNTKGEDKEYLDEGCKIKNGQVIGNDLLDIFFLKILERDRFDSNSCVKVGTGSSPTDLTSSTLETPYVLGSGHWPASSNTDYSGTRKENGKVILPITWTYEFDIGQIVGNISELGITVNESVLNNPNSGSINYRTNNTVHTRLLIKDTQGNPTTISVLADEQLRVTYTLEASIDEAPYVQSMNYNNDGTQTPITITRYRTGYGNFASLVSIAYNTSRDNLYLTDTDVGGNESNPVFPDYSEDVQNTITHDNTVSGTAVRKCKFLWGGNQAVFPTGIKSIVCSSRYDYYDPTRALFKWVFDNPIIKNTEQKIEITFITTVTRI